VWAWVTSDVETFTGTGNTNDVRQPATVWPGMPLHHSNDRLHSSPVSLRTGIYALNIDHANTCRCGTQNPDQ